MKVQQTNPVILRKLGLEALCKSLGPLGMVRFLQQYEAGTGDYTKERGLLHFCKPAALLSYPDKFQQEFSLVVSMGDIPNLTWNGM